MSDESRVYYIKSEPFLLYLGIIGGLWLLLDSFLHLILARLSDYLYHASLIKAVFKFNLNKKLPET